MTNRQRWLFAGLMLPVVAALVWLGIWQLHRRVWKLGLIHQVEQRLASVPVPAPGPDAWSRIGAGDAYRRVRVQGVYQPGKDTRVRAVTELGGGYWVLTPFTTDSGFTLLINRGYVPEDMAVPTPPAGEVSASGLLRVSEPNFGFLRNNVPQADRWYSRDLPEIARRRGLGRVAPYFIDADAATSPGWPRGGLTVISFPNNHLQYALTWFAMAILLSGAIIWIVFGRRTG